MVVQVEKLQVKSFIHYNASQGQQAASSSNFGTWPTLMINGPPFCGKTTLLKAICGVKVTRKLGRRWRDWIRSKNAPCLLHLEDIECMEKHSPPVGSFRLTCYLKSQLLSNLSGSGVVVVGETRCLLASLPQPVLHLFNQTVSFGMLSERHRLELLSSCLDDETDKSTEPPVPSKSSLTLADQLTCKELARLTPGYEIGDLLRLLSHLHMSALYEAAAQSTESGREEEEQDCFTPLVEPKRLCVTRSLLNDALSCVVPAIKNTAEFVTIPDVTWDDVGGLEGIKTQLHNRFMLLVNDWDRAQLLKRRSGGVLLEGPPGCGKTLIAKALSNQAGLNFLSIKGPEVLNKFQGESERRVREVFERARACQPCLVFFDEIDAICPKRDSDESSGSRVSLVNQLLVELDGIDKHKSGRLFVVGATNRKDMIDPALLRPGRLGLHLTVEPPKSSEERLGVLSACTKQATWPEIEGGLTTLHELASDTRTEGMSGADLDNLLETAKEMAQLNGQDRVNRVDLFNALSTLTSGDRQKQ